MGERKILGLIYGYNEGWIAGSYYIENLIACLLLLPENERPLIKVYVFDSDSRDKLMNKGFAEQINVILIRDGQNLIDRLINKVSYWLTERYLIVRGFDQKVDAIFPNPSAFHFHRMRSPIFWIPDFQDKHFPAFFSVEEIERRSNSHKAIAQNKDKFLVLSSKSALTDYKSFYPEQQSRNFVIPFAVTIPDIEGIDRRAVLEKYRGSADYFICSNQFWAHKGHKTLLQAIAVIKSTGKPINVVFTGKTEDNRNPHFFGQLLKMIEDLDISDSVNFLGFIPREDQLVLMSASIAILQPSQFEGWSTVVEDAKILNKPLVVSDLPVHKEQLPNDYSGFFETDSIDSLSSKMLEGIEGNITRPNLNYPEFQKDFGRRILAMLDDLS